MIHLSPGGMLGFMSDAELRPLQQQFEREHYVKLRGLLAPQTIELMQRFVAELAFVHRVHGKIGTEYCLPDGRAVRLMTFLVNDPALYDVVQRITDCARIGCFTGRVYRMLPGTDDYDNWHTDNIEDRLVGMSVNLGEAYEGGVFQLRDKASGQILCEAPNVVPGDAILFRISRQFEHWITPMAGSTPKTAFAGWFKGSPEFFALIGRDGEERTGEGNRDR